MHKSTDTLTPVEFRRPICEDLPSIVKLLLGISPYSPNPQDFDRIWTEFESQGRCEALVCIRDMEIIAYGVVLIETKIRGGRIGHIEDVVVRANEQGKGIGKLLISQLVYQASMANCYKVTLHCKQDTSDFYESCGFSVNGNSMQKMI